MGGSIVKLVHSCSNGDVEGNPKGVGEKMEIPKGRREGEGEGGGYRHFL